MICVQTPVLPLTAHESFSHVSLPNSPGRGMVLNVQSSLPVRTSNARTSPLVLLCVLTVAPSRNDEPMMTTSLTMAGVACRPISPVSRSIGWPVAEHRALLQIDDAVRAERADRRAVLRVERDQAVAGRDVEDAFVAAAVGPVRDAAARQLPRRDAGALSLAQAVRPDQLAGLAVERDDRAPRAAGGVEHAVDRERRAFELVLGTRAEAVGLEAPRHFELAEVGGVDLIERRVLGAADVGGVVRPVAAGRDGWREAGACCAMIPAATAVSPSVTTITARFTFPSGGCSLAGIMYRMAVSVTLGYAFALTRAAEG